MISNGLTTKMGRGVLRKLMLKILRTMLNDVAQEQFFKGFINFLAAIAVMLVAGAIVLIICSGITWLTGIAIDLVALVFPFVILLLLWVVSAVERSSG